MQPIKAGTAQMELIEKGVEGLLVEERKNLLAEVLGDFYDKPLMGCDKQRKGLYTARLVVTSAIKAIESLKGGKLEQLDPLVSECQCQLRALKIAYLANKLLVSETFRKELDTMQTALTKLQSDLQKLAQSTKTTISTVHQLEKSPRLLVGDEVLVTEDVVTLTQCYMLSLAKSMKRREEECSHCRSVIPSVAEVTEVSKLAKLQKGTFESEHKTIVYRAKEKLAKSSCESLEVMVKQVVGEAAVVLGKLKREVGKESKKVELPSFYSLMAVIKVALAEDIPLLLKVKRAAHNLEVPAEPFELAVLYVATDKKEYKVAPLTAGYSRKAAIIIEAQRVGKDEESVHDYIMRLGSLPIEEIIEMNAASHRMYTDGDEPLLDLIDSAEQKRLKDLREKAIKIGCAKKSQQLLCINHIFADIVSNQIKGLYIKE